MSAESASEFLTIIRSTDWSRLSHAYARADDTPKQLAVLAYSRDAKARSAALDHLWGAVLHQGTLYSATPPAVLAVAALLADPQITEPVERWTDMGEEPLPLRASLLDFLASFAESCAVALDEPIEAMAHVPGRDAEIAELEAGWTDRAEPDSDPPDDELMNAVYARALLASRRVCPQLIDPVVRLLEDPLFAVRMRAANCIAKLCQQPELNSHRSSLSAAIDKAARAAGTQERAVLVLSLGDLGADTSTFLGDPDQAVRCCAALAPSQFENPAATLLPAALAIARGPAHVMTVERDWGPLLADAFPTPPDGSLSRAQHDYLAALVNNDELWNPRNGNALIWFKRLGMRYDRDACRSLLQGGG